MRNHKKPSGLALSLSRPFGSHTQAQDTFSQKQTSTSIIFASVCLFTIHLFGRSSKRGAPTQNAFIFCSGLSRKKERQRAQD